MTSIFMEEKYKTQNHLDGNSLLALPNGEAKTLKQMFYEQA